MINTLDNQEYVRMNEMSKSMTNDDCNRTVISEAETKHCPAVNDYCLCEGCAFFVVDRPCVDRRILKATCTYAGKRDLAMWYGFPKGEIPEV